MLHYFYEGLHDLVRNIHSQLITARSMDDAIDRMYLEVAELVAPLGLSLKVYYQAEAFRAEEILSKPIIPYKMFKSDGHGVAEDFFESSLAGSPIYGESVGHSAEFLNQIMGGISWKGIFIQDPNRKGLYILSPMAEQILKQDGAFSEKENQGIATRLRGYINYQGKKIVGGRMLTPFDAFSVLLGFEAPMPGVLANSLLPDMLLGTVGQFGAKGLYPADTFWPYRAFTLDRIEEDFKRMFLSMYQVGVMQDFHLDQLARNFLGTLESSRYMHAIVVEGVDHPWHHPEAKSKSDFMAIRLDVAQPSKKGGKTVILKLDVTDEVIPVPLRLLQKPIMTMSRMINDALLRDRVSEKVRRQRAMGEFLQQEVAQARQDAEMTSKMNQMLLQQMKEKEGTDSLTGLHNMYGYFVEFARNIYHRQAKNPDSTTVIAFGDVDKFKSFNDIFGHNLGDRILAQIGTLSGRSFRGQDIVSHPHGDEFCFIMPDCDAENGNVRLLSFLESLQNPKNAIELIVPFSVPQHSLSEDDLLQFARIAGKTRRSSENIRQWTIKRSEMHKLFGEKNDTLWHDLFENPNAENLVFVNDFLIKLKLNKERFIPEKYSAFRNLYRNTQGFFDQAMMLEIITDLLNKEVLDCDMFCNIDHFFALFSGSDGRNSILPEPWYYNSFVQFVSERSRLIEQRRDETFISFLLKAIRFQCEHNATDVFEIVEKADSAKLTAFLLSKLSEMGFVLDESGFESKHEASKTMNQQQLKNMIEDTIKIISTFMVNSKSHEDILQFLTIDSPKLGHVLTQLSKDKIVLKLRASMTLGMQQVTGAELQKEVQYNLDQLLHFFPESDKTPLFGQYQAIKKQISAVQDKDLAILMGKMDQVLKVITLDRLSEFSRQELAAMMALSQYKQNVDLLMLKGKAEKKRGQVIV